MAKNSRAKRKDKPAPTVIEFDDAGRKDFLTGFHKRKVERKNKYLEKKMLREKEERREARAAVSIFLLLLLLCYIHFVLEYRDLI